jgi:hypothetical protein
VPDESNPLYEIFENHKKGPLVHKWLQYFDVYHRYFQKYRGQQLTVLEIGIQSGGTIPMWQAYFGEGLTYYGADLNPYCKGMYDDPPRTNILVGDQASSKFWAELKALNVKFDIIIDDGGHTMKQQIMTFQECWDLINDGGIFFCEDTSTSMDSVYGFAIPPDPQAGHGAITPTAKYEGGYKRNNTWLEYSKQFVDIVHGHYVNRTAHPEFDPLQRSSSVVSAAFYDQIVVLEKGPHPVPPRTVLRGNFKLPFRHTPDVDPKLLAAYNKRLAAALEA